MSLQQELNAIACETCRSKKCKCDRKLSVSVSTQFPHQPDSSRPSCSQCQTSSSPCRYQEGGKRGLPAAYMTSLETRLRNTETALYALLCTLQAQGGTVSIPPLLDAEVPTSRRPQRSKAEKQSDWKRLPLRTSEDLGAWFDEQHRRFRSSSDIRQDVAPSRDRKFVPFSADTSLNVSASKVQDGGIPAHAQQRLVPSDAVMVQLRNCRPPTVPNGTATAATPATWADNYF